MDIDENGKSFFMYSQNSGKGEYLRKSHDDKHHVLMEANQPKNIGLRRKRYRKLLN